MPSPPTPLATSASPKPRISSRSALVWAVVAAIIALAAFRAPALRAAAARALSPLARPASSSSLGSTMPAATGSDREWNVLADGMDRFHAHFRYEFNRVYTLADGSFHKEGMTLPRFIREAQQLAHHLDVHHRIAYIFPILGKKMPQFKDGAREKGQHLVSHKKIHDGLDRYEAFLSATLANPSSYSAETLRGIMDGFRDVLFNHLDEEVHDLGHASMKAAGWTLDEIRKIPM